MVGLRKSVNFTFCYGSIKSCIISHRRLTKINRDKPSHELVLEETDIYGCFVIKFPENSDARGNFFRKYSEEDFIEKGLNSRWVQTNFSSNKYVGTLRGFHYQNEPFQEVKLVTCVSGSVFDVILDLRPESRTYLKTFSFTLNSNSNTSIYIAKGVAHAYLTLVDNSSVVYQVSDRYSLAHTSGVRYSDPKIKVPWPLTPTNISDNDLSWDLL